MFESLAPKDSSSRAILKGTLVVLLVVYLSIGMMSAYRAWFQVKSLDLKSTDVILRDGSVVETTLVSYARTTIDVRVELVQGSHAETIAMKRLRGNEWAFFDPRSRQASESTVLTAEILGRFDKGPAQLRATAVGREQWTRLPPPVVREIIVEISGD